MERRAAEDLKGQTFGLLKVVDRSYASINGAMWICRCKCGKLKVVRATQLRNQSVKSCGCLKRGREKRNG